MTPEFETINPRSPVKIVAANDLFVKISNGRQVSLDRSETSSLPELRSLR